MANTQTTCSQMSRCPDRRGLELDREGKKMRGKGRGFLVLTCVNDEGCRGGARDSKLAMESRTWRHNDGGCVGRRKMFKGRALCKEEDDGRRGTGSYNKGRWEWADAVVNGRPV